MFRHGYTYPGHATVAAAALANLDLLEREEVVDRAAELEKELAAALLPLAEHPLVGEVRAGTGVLAAVQLDAAATAADPTLVRRAVPAARRNGIMTRMLATHAFQISPPLVLEPSEVLELAHGLAATLDDLQAGGPP